MTVEPVDCPDCGDPIDQHSDEGCLAGWRYYVDDDTGHGPYGVVEGCLCPHRGPKKLADVPTEDLRS